MTWMVTRVLLMYSICKYKLRSGVEGMYADGAAWERHVSIPKDIWEGRCQKPKVHIPTHPVDSLMGASCHHVGRLKHEHMSLTTLWGPHLPPPTPPVLLVRALFPFLISHVHAFYSRLPFLVVIITSLLTRAAHTSVSEFSLAHRTRSGSLTSHRFTLASSLTSSSHIPSPSLASSLFSLGLHSQWFAESQPSHPRLISSDMSQQRGSPLALSNSRPHSSSRSSEDLL